MSVMMERLSDAGPNVATILVFLWLIIIVLCVVGCNLNNAAKVVNKSQTLSSA